jgi:hypothetical protein
LDHIDTLLHEFALKTDKAIYIKHFKILDTHSEEVEKHITEWLKLVIIQLVRSKFNGPIFTVAKNNEIWLVLDLKALNVNTRIENLLNERCLRVHWGHPLSG